MTKKIARRRGRPRDAKSHIAVLDAALQVLESEGYAAATIERIAAEAGVAKQTIYRWWNGKATLFMEVLAREAGQSVELPDTGSFNSDVAALLTGTFAAVSSKLRPVMRALAVEVLHDEVFAATMRDVFVQRRRENVRDLVQKGIRRGELSNLTDAELVCDILFGTMWYRLMFDHAKLDKLAAEQLSSVAYAVAVQNPRTPSIRKV
ncbi:MAG: TetR/AcrR family transcriptional regulator [Pseudomonadota bacterium]